MSLKDYHSVYFLGIGGIGMSALARYFKSQGYKVSGYDKTNTRLTKELENEGIDILFNDSVEAIPQDVLANLDHTLLVYTPAIPQDMPQFVFLKTKSKLLKRSQVLGMITENEFTIAVAGTHGKTTTCSILAYLLNEANCNFTALLGGIPTNFGTNFIQNKAEGRHVFLVEADEYDRSFLTLHPNIAIVTSTDADHLDIYGDSHHLKSGFVEFIQKINKSGSLISHEKLAELESAADCEVIQYGTSRGHFFASNITIDDGFFIFDLYAKNSIYRSLKLGVPGFYNIENSIAALIALQKIGVDIEQLTEKLEFFKGVRRRFEFAIRREDFVMIDDYAHHPEEIKSFLGSVRELYPSKTIVGIFQPHLFTRTRDFAEGFGESLSIADEVMLMEIYPAREKPIPGITSEMLLNHITTEKCKVVSRAYLLEEYNPEPNSVVCIIGAGDIDTIVQPLKLKWSHV